MADSIQYYWVWFVVGISVIILLVLFIALLNSSAKRRREYDIQEINQVGKAGEEFVAGCLQEIVDGFGGYLFNDFCFEDRKGYSTEIDHILITRGGLFIIETKTNRGTIHGEINDEKWLCVKKEYQEDKILRNPIIQNQRHINNLRKVYKGKIPKMCSIIIFSLADADITNVHAENVFDVPGAMAFLKQITSEAHYSQEFVERTKRDIEYIQKHYSISKERHIKNIQRLHKK